MNGDAQSKPGGLDPKDALTLYETGKSRRYSLLFAVNGGAFAVAKLVGENKVSVGDLSIWTLSIGMIVFTITMTLDIFAFGFWCKNKFKQDIFRRIGWTVLSIIGALICVGWFLVGLNDGNWYVRVGFFISLGVGAIFALRIGGHFKLNSKKKPAIDPRKAKGTDESIQNPHRKSKIPNP